MDKSTDNTNKMKFEDVVNNRRSVREYKEKKVPKKILKEVIEDAIKAPSAGNSQPWEFYIINSKKKRDEFSKLMYKGFKKYEKEILKLSPKIQKVAKKFYSDIGGCQNIIIVYSNEKGENKVMSVCAAIENLMLSAVNKGLGTCWLGTTKDFEKEVSKILGVKNKKLVAGVLIGYSKGKSLIRKKKKVDEVLRFK
jgi:nitroreductase